MGRTSLTAQNLGIALDGGALALDVDGATRSADAVRYAHEDGVLECDVYAPPYADKSATGSTVEPDNTVPKPLRGLTVHGAAGGAVAAGATSYFAHDLSDKRSESNPDGFWASVNSGFTILQDGWAHLRAENTGSSSIFAVLRPAPQAFAEQFAEYTLLVELENVSASGTVDWIPNRATNSATLPQIGTNLVSQPIATARYAVAVRDDLADCVYFTDSYFRLQPGASIECDIRMSMCHGDYQGPYCTDQQMMLGCGNAWTPIEVGSIVLGSSDTIDVAADGSATATVGGATTALPDVEMPTEKAGDAIMVEASIPVEITATWADTEREDA